MLVYIVMDRESRCRVLQPGPYLAALIALGLFAPHVFWMARNDFITIHYGLERSADKSTLMSHFKNPVLFSLSQFYRLLPVVFVLLPLIPGRWRFRTLTPDERRDRDYLLFTVAGPVGLLLLVSFVTGGQIREIWGSPLWAFVGLLLLVALRLDVDAAALARARGRFALVAASFVVFALLKNYCEPALWKRPGRIHFPGPQLAEEVTRLWAEHSARPFAIVGGECWIAGNISFYALHRPSMYSSGSVGYPVMEARATPWTSDADMSARGGILVWDAARTGDDLPAEFRQRFPAARLQQVLVLPYQCLSELPPVRVGLAFVLPGESTGGMVAASVSSSQ
jgi:hypothetical protein